MKLWKYGLLIISIFAVVLSSGVVSATSEIIDDAVDDVYHIDTTKPFGQQMTENIGNQPNVDIDKVTCVIADRTLTVTLELVSDGIVQHEIDMDYSYNIQFTTSDGGMYIIMVNYGGEGGQGTGPATPAENAGGELDISGNVLKMVWVFEGDATVTDLTADASYSPTETSTYRDIANADSGGNGGTGGTGDTGGTGGTDGTNGNKPKPSTPGFEAVAVLAAIGVAFILLNIRRK